MTKFKRNDVVYLKDESFFSFYGRVIRVFPDGKVEWVCCGKYHHISDPESIIKTDYRGYWEGKHFVKMPTIRKLKKSAQKYVDKSEWKTYKCVRYS